MACPNAVTLCFVAGNTLTIDWAYTSNEGAPISLVGATAEMQFLNKITDVAYVIVLTGGITDEVNGTGTFSLTNTQTQGLLPVVQDENDAITFVSRIKLTFADTTTRTIASVTVTIEQGGIR